MCFLLLQHLLTGTSWPHKTQNSFIIVTKAMRNQISLTSTKADAYLTERREEDPPLCSCFHEESACTVYSFCIYTVPLLLYACGLLKKVEICRTILSCLTIRYVCVCGTPVTSFMLHSCPRGMIFPPAVNVLILSITNSWLIVFLCDNKRHWVTSSASPAGRADERRLRGAPSSATPTLTSLQRASVSGHSH